MCVCGGGGVEEGRGREGERGVGREEGGRREGSGTGEKELQREPVGRAGGTQASLQFTLLPLQHGSSLQ